MRGGPVPEDQPSSDDHQSAAKQADDPSLPPIAPGWADKLATQIDGVFIVVVQLDGERRRRRAYFTIASAQRHARQAQATGHGASVYLAQLRPVGQVTP